MLVTKLLRFDGWRVSAGSGRRDSGAAALEFALILPALVLLTLGIIEFGFLFQNQLALTHAAREGARMAAIGTWNQAEVAQRALPTTPVITTNPTPVSSAVRGQAVTVTLRHQYDWMLLPFPGTITLRGEATMRREW